MAQRGRLYLPGALPRVVDALRRNPDAQWLTGPCLIVDGHGQEIRGAVTAYRRALLRRHRFTALLVQNYVATPATFMRREAVIALCGFDERFPLLHGLRLWLRLVARQEPVVLDEPLAVFRMAGGSLSMSGFESQFAERAQNAREHGVGHPLPLMANGLVSPLIVLVLAYRLLRAARARRSP